MTRKPDLLFIQQFIVLIIVAFLNPMCAFAHAAPPDDPATLFQQGKTFEEARGEAKDERKAYELYFKAANAGNPPAMAKLAAMYLYGTWEGQSDLKAVEWARKATDAGHLGAMVMLGWMYENGRGVEL